MFDCFKDAYRFIKMIFMCKKCNDELTLPEVIELCKPELPEDSVVRAILPDGPVDHKLMTKKELLDVARSRNVKVNVGMSKSQIAKRINAAL